MIIGRLQTAPNSLPMVVIPTQDPPRRGKCPIGRTRMSQRMRTTTPHAPPFAAQNAARGAGGPLATACRVPVTGGRWGSREPAAHHACSEPHPRDRNRAFPLARGHLAQLWRHCFEKPVRKVVVDLSLSLTPLTAESEEVVGGPISLQFTQQHLIGSHTMSPAELRVVLLILGFLVTDSTLGDPCVTHTVLDQPWRSTDCSNTECTGGQWMSDVNLEVGWYRFNSSGGWKIPETVVLQYRCSGYYPGWLNGPHPNVGEGEVTRTICFTGTRYTCYWRREIKVKNCSGYFVYWLWNAPSSNAMYCTDSALGDPCVTHTVLDQPWRSTNCSNTVCTGGYWMDDGNLEVGWYRFNSSGGWKIPETVVPEYRCSGYYPGWLNGPHPNVGEGEVIRTVCFTHSIYTCYWSQEIKVKNCSRYFVYWLWNAPSSNAVYCTVIDSTLGDPCVAHTVLDQTWRSTDCSNTVCTGGQWMDDGNLEVGWYRFNSSGGWKIPETVVPEYRCSGYYPGWLNGPHPNVGEGEVTRTVCFTWGGNTCYWRREINVKNCSGYFVYRLWRVPLSNAVYCTDSALGDPCVTHTVLDQPWRSTNCSNTVCTGGYWMDDGNLEVGWYRFNSSGGWKIPETVVPEYRCSGYYPGWLNGRHPNVGEGEVIRTVCFTQGEFTCDWNRRINVKNCSSYFVYWLWNAPLNNAVYCTDLETSTLEQSTGLSTGEHTQELSSVPVGDTSSDLHSDTTQEPQGPATGEPGLSLTTSPEGSTSSDLEEPSSAPTGTSGEEDGWIDVRVTSSGDMSEEEVREAVRNKLREMFDDPDPQIELVQCTSEPPEE
ncbi:uncharacterized protein LOC134339928 [Mobula hypostoma]|uniref:uncharacterized protein LOC134339928 n=1 Tax=Mobula hypostoma TaxID=723540 RepID=UPI002FC34932